MRLIRGKYDEAKARIKEMIYEGYKLDEIFANTQFTEISSYEIIVLYSELKQLFESTMIIRLELSNNDAKNIYTNSVVSMNKFIDNMVINKMVNKFKSNVEEELFATVNTNKNLTYINRMMEAANSKIVDEEGEKKND